MIQRVIRVIATSQRIPAENISLESTFEELKIDSLAGIEILFALESEFDIDIPDEAVHSIKGIRGMVEGVASLLAVKQSAGAPAPSGA
ncbi:MAG: acyl carrier protein [Bryobacteraceae bacterium]|nr:acyl carrier protein [Bryobacteraceae bacterium]